MATKTNKDRYETYEVFDERGRSVGRVVLPRTRRPFGTDRGTVYLNRQTPKVPATPTNPRAA